VHAELLLQQADDGWREEQTLVVRVSGHYQSPHFFTVLRRRGYTPAGGRAAQQALQGRPKRPPLSPINTFNPNKVEECSE